VYYSHVRIGSARHLAQLYVLVEQIRQAEALRQRRGQDEAGVGDEAVRVKTDVKSVR
jgi:hypothetical protein